ASLSAIGTLFPPHFASTRRPGNGDSTANSDSALKNPAAEPAGFFAFTGHGMLASRGLENRKKRILMCCVNPLLRRIAIIAGES
ncbi:hypothetical protein, partial [Candidatus Dactylopiibacterium carminicum]|uniref:hypothetical protein n=1 Tax=Candidatus Dactylopiibacterium carminicum TaxID=857335 RepID=UPI001CC2D07F